MRRILVTLIVGAGAAMFSYTPTAAQWLTIGREQGYVPETLPAEMTDPPAVGAAVLTVIVFAVGYIVRLLLGFTGLSSPLRTEIVVKAVTQQIESGARKITPPGWEKSGGAVGTADHGRELIDKRLRRAEIRRDIEAADAEREELTVSHRLAIQDAQEFKKLHEASEINVTRSRDRLLRDERDRDELKSKHSAATSRISEIAARLQGLGAAKQDMISEQSRLS
jgi:hypothetical protein